MRSDHIMKMCRTRCFNRCCLGSGASADHCCYTIAQGFPALRRRFKMYMYIDTAGCQNHSFTGNQFCSCPYDESGCNIHCIRVTALSNAYDFTVFDTNITFYDTDHRVDNDCICKYCIQYSVFCSCTGDIAHAVTVSLAAAEHHFISVARRSVVFFDFSDETCISQMDLVTCCRSVHITIFTSG